MNYGLNITKKGALDFLSLGALVHASIPASFRFGKPPNAKSTLAVASSRCANLSDCFRLQTAVTTAMVDYPIGDLIAERVRAMGVRPFYKHFKHDGVNGPNMATVYSDRGHGVRAPVVFYNRCNEAAAQLKPGDFDWKKSSPAAVRLVPQRRHLRRAFTFDRRNHHRGHAGRQSRRGNSLFDLNYRAKLWNISGGHDRAVAVLDRHR